MSMEPNPTAAPPVKAWSPGAAKAPSVVQVRSLYLIVWAIATASLLAEYVLTWRDLHRSRTVAWALTSGREDPDREGGAEDGGRKALEARIADLSSRLDAREDEIARLEADLARAREEARERSAANEDGPAEGADPFAPQEPGTTGRGDPRGGAPGEDLFAPDPDRDVESGGPWGRIIVRDPESEFAAIDLGSQDGIRKGMTLPLRAGGQEVGTFLVLEVRSAVSAGRIVTRGGRPAGDEVRVERW